MTGAPSPSPRPIGDKAEAVHTYLVGFQDRVTGALEEIEAGATFDARVLQRERGGLACPRVLSNGRILERAAVNFSHAYGDRLPPAATERRSDLKGCSFEAVSTSLIVHPVNPYAPTCHANLRFFQALGPGGVSRDWWLGGGFDLTPYYGFDEDAVHWHQMAQDACDPFGPDLYPRFKKDCDEYFYLPHREEARGIGGLFFDDLTSLGPNLSSGERDRDRDFEQCFAFVRSVGDHYLDAYMPILRRRQDTPYGERERGFQLYRRGRYVEFNLVYDRGTRYGLQVSGRTESILASLPPQVEWRYDWQPEEGSEEQRLTQWFLKPKDWLSLSGSGL